MIFLPVAFVALAAAGTFYSLLGDRQRSDSSDADARLNAFQTQEKLRFERLMQKSCFLGTHAAQLAETPKMPENVDLQRAISLSTLRLSCLAEGSARLGPKAATALWAVYLKSPTETLAQSLTQTICPKIKLHSERFRKAARSTNTLRRTRETVLSLNLRELRVSRCSAASIPASLLDRFAPAILDRWAPWRFSSVGRAVD